MIKRTYTLESLKITNFKGLLTNTFTKSKVTIGGDISIFAEDSFFDDLTGEITISGVISSVLLKTSEMLKKPTTFSEKIELVSGKTSLLFPKKFSADITVSNATDKSVKIDSAKVVNLDPKTKSYVTSFTCSAVLKFKEEEDGVTPPDDEDEDVVGDRKIKSVKLVSKQGSERKGSGLDIDPSGRVIELIYDNKSRKDTWIFIDGVKKITTDAETGNVFFTPDGRTWISFEKGKSGRCSELVGNKLRDLGFNVHYCGCGLSFNGKPYFMDCAGSGASPEMKDEKGKVFLKFKGNGIPYDAVVSPVDGTPVISLADGGGNGIAWGTGEYIKCDARALIVFKGRLLAGIGGYVKDVTSKSIKDFSPIGIKLGDSIDSMCIDSSGSLWLSSSSPDALYRLSSSGLLEKVDSYEDDKDGGALFRTRVASKKGRVLWGRNNKKDSNKWELREVMFEAGSGSGSGTTPTPPTGSKDILENAVWLAPNNSKFKSIESWPIVTKLEVKDLGPRTGRFIVDKPHLTGECWVCFFVYRDGRWIGGGIDGIKGSGQVKSCNNATSSNKGGPLPGRYGPTKNESENRKYLRARKGEKVVFCLISETSKTRTSGFEIVWQNSTYGSV